MKRQQEKYQNIKYYQPMNCTLKLWENEICLHNTCTFD